MLLFKIHRLTIEILPLFENWEYHAFYWTSKIVWESYFFFYLFIHRIKYDIEIIFKLNQWLYLNFVLMKLSTLFTSINRNISFQNILYIILLMGNSLLKQTFKPILFQWVLFLLLTAWGWWLISIVRFQYLFKTIYHLVFVENNGMTTLKLLFVCQFHRIIYQCLKDADDV